MHGFITALLLISLTDPIIDKPAPLVTTSGLVVGGTQAAAKVPIAQSAVSTTWQTISGDFTLNASGLATLSANISTSVTFLSGVAVSAGAKFKLDPGGVGFVGENGSGTVRLIGDSGASGPGLAFGNATTLTSGNIANFYKDAGSTLEAFIDYTGRGNFLGVDVGQGSGYVLYTDFAGNIITLASQGFKASGSLVASYSLANQLTLDGSTSTNPVTITATGTDTNINIALVPKAGYVQAPALHLTNNSGLGLSIGDGSYFDLSGGGGNFYIQRFGGVSYIQSAEGIIIDDNAGDATNLVLQVTGTGQVVVNNTGGFDVGGTSLANQLILNGSISASPVTLQAQGSDATVSIALESKGNANVEILNSNLTLTTGFQIYSGYYYPVNVGDSAKLAGWANDGASAVNMILNSLQALSTPGAKLVSIQNNNVEKAFFGYDGTLYAPVYTGGTLNLSAAGGCEPLVNSSGFSCQDGSFTETTGKVSVYSSVATAGQGLSPTRSYGNVPATSSTAVTIATFTPTAAGLYEVGGFEDVTAFSSGVVAILVSYTDNEGTAHNSMNMFGTTTGNAQAANLAGTGNLRYYTTTIAVSASTAITLATQISGTATADFYGFIRQVE